MKREELAKRIKVIEDALRAARVECERKDSVFDAYESDDVEAILAGYGVTESGKIADAVEEQADPDDPTYFSAPLVQSAALRQWEETLPSSVVDRRALMLHPINSVYGKIPDPSSGAFVHLADLRAFDHDPALEVVALPATPPWLPVTESLFEQGIAHLDPAEVRRESPPCAGHSRPLNRIDLEVGVAPADDTQTIGILTGTADLDGGDDV